MSETQKLFLDEAGLNELVDRTRTETDSKINSAINTHNSSSDSHSDIRNSLNEAKEKLDTIEDGANRYTLPKATGSTLGGVTIGDNVQVSNGKISVKNSTTSQPGVVQLTDSTSSTSTTTAATPNSVKKAYDLANTAKTNAVNAQTSADEAKASAVTAQTTAESGVSKANTAQSAVDALNDEVTAHTGNSDVHFTAAERTKLSGIEAGAQKNTITGIKGSSESSYRTGNVNITKANIGLGNVNNTADSAKPVSTAQQTAIDSALAESKSYTDTKISGHNHDTKYDTKGAADVALDEAKDYTDTKVANLASTTVVDNKISSHNVSTSSHNDIRNLITALTTKVNNFLDVDDTTTDQLSEVLTLINNNKGTLDSLTSGKVNVSDIVDNLTTSSSTKVLSAKQGVALKGLIDTLQTALDALESEFDGHGHVIADVSGLQTALDGKAAKSHGTHVSYSTTAPVMDGKASVGSASTVARSDHKHPTDTSRASQVDLDALEAIVDGKANNAHSHAIPDIANLQTILDAKQSIITGGASTITGSNLTANRALVSNGSGKVAVSAVTSTELGYLDGVTSNIQTQINSLNHNIFNMIYPVGSIYMSVNSTNPGDLFGGTWVSWGSGRVPVGVNADDSNFDTVEKSGGESTHTLTTDEMAKHTHTFTGSAVTSGTGGVAHTHSIPSLSGDFTYDIFNHIHNVSGNVAANGNHTHTLNPLKLIKDGGSGTAKNRVVGNPTTSGASASSGNYGTSLAGSHNHSLNLNTSTASILSMIPTSGDIRTNASTSGAASATSHTHSVTAKGTNSNTGSGSAHNNLQPYITCYMWKRTA